VRAVVDTNVVAYLLFGPDALAREAASFVQNASVLLAPAHWEAELTNVVWMAVRTGVLSPAEGAIRLGLARQLGVESMATASLCRGALLRSIESRVSVYDTLFVELAVRTGCPLATFDKELWRAFPDIAARPREFGRA
jgi:predicted nucleic acid-binding protein